MNIINKYKIFFIIAALVLILLLILVVKFATSKKVATNPEPVSSTKIITPPNIQSIPTLPPSKGEGIDTQSQPVEESQGEIDKLTPYLPYEDSFDLLTGVKVSVLIPQQKYQNNPWTLTVQIFGINYNSSPDQPDYIQMRASFKEASSKVFAWMKSKGANPEKIFISWGDKEFIQKNAEDWLK
jgi:hypothetical protein